MTSAQPGIPLASRPTRRRNCRDCEHFRVVDAAPRCRFRGGKPSGICAVFKLKS